MANNAETQNQNATSDELKFAIPERGYGTYLKGILPDDQRVLAGAFSVSMQQIRNIDQVPLEKFAQAAYSNENMFGLNLVNGTDVPTDVRLARISQDICAVGGGVYGTFTMSNFFGAMSSLPYPLREIYNGIKQLETDTLKTIYQNLYLTVTWNPAGNATVTYSNDGLGNYTFTGISFAEGGGYCREGAAPPSISVAGATGNLIVGTDPDDLATYGKIIGNTFTASGTTTSPTFSVAIPEPPTTHGSSGWSPGMNNAVQYYIDAANAEILAITTSSPNNFEVSKVLNVNWDITGKALKQEQRARYIASAPVPVPFDKWLATYPTSQYIFVDALPTLASNTLPHMYAQTLENISDLDLTGGQSVVGLMRESRNQERLNRAGLQLDNNLANDLTPQDKEQLLTNGTLPGAIGDEGINGYPIPVFPGETPAGELVGIPVPVSYYDPCLPGLMCYNEIQYVQADPTAAILAAPAPEPEVPFESLPFTPIGYEAVLGGPEILPSGTDVPVPDQSFPCEGARVEPLYGAKPSPVATAVIGTGAAVACDPPVDYPVGINQPPIIIPPELDGELTASTLSPSAPTVQQAIDQVIKCNCDCWVA